MIITNAQRIALNIPFYAPHVTRAMHRGQSFDERVYLYRLETDNDLVAHADSTVSTPVDHLIGQNPYAIMHDDRIGFGPQVACLDLVGKDAGVPVHALLGTRIRGRYPISWWDIDMAPADWVKEAKESIRRGYTSFKMKARPWWDVVEQVTAVGRVVPDDYRFDIDFNGFLLTPAAAEVLLHQLDDHPNVGMYESPFYLWNDLDGGRRLCRRVRKPVMEHFHEAVLHARASDGFVICHAGVTETREQGILAASFNKPCWIQLPGAGVTRTLAAHLGSVLTHAYLPCIIGCELWKSDLIAAPPRVVDGHIPVPDSPGLGVEVDERAVGRYTVDERELTPRRRYRNRKRILRVTRPGPGKTQRVREFTDEPSYQQAFASGSLPGFEPGAALEVIEDDGSASFRRRHRKVCEEEKLG